MPRIQPRPETHVISGNPRCPICGNPAEVYRQRLPPEPFEGFCETCGDVLITLSAVEKAGTQGKKHLVSAWLRRRPAGTPVEILGDEDIDAIIKDTPTLSVLEKLDRTLSLISSMTNQPGQPSRFRYLNDYPLIYAESSGEALFYLRELGALNYVKEEMGTARMLAKGYQRLFEIQRASRESAFVFVAMWFDPSMSEIYDGAIETAVREAGYKAVRIDREQHANRIDEEIIGRIKGSRFMVADFTGQRAGVYFEAGFMLGLGRTVVWMCNKRELAEVHFDTRQYNFIDYEDIAEAKKRLYDRIVAIEGEGPELTVAQSSFT